jgi:hypothetical protein
MQEGTVKFFDETKGILVFVLGFKLNNRVSNLDKDIKISVLLLFYSFKFLN